MERLWDIEQIKQLKAQLKATYCYYVDESFEDPTNFDRLMREVFVDDTELELLDLGPSLRRADVTEVATLTG